MSYHGYINVVKAFIDGCVPPDGVPTLLEIGVDRGVTMIPLVAFLARTRKSFSYVGVDIKAQEQVSIMLDNLDLTPDQRACLIEKNSLELLPLLVAQSAAKFDVILIDGDHNYHTVSEELKYVEALTYPTSIIICDDVFGRWSERDLFYSERPDYEDNKIATRKVETEKHGVKPAVDEWLSSHPEWHMYQPIKGEAVVLMKR